MQTLASSLKDGKLRLTEALGGEGDLGSQRFRAALLIGLLVDGVAGGLLPPGRFVESVQEIEAYKETGADNYELGDAIWIAWCLEGRNAEAAGRLVDVSTSLMDKGCLSRRVLMEISDGDFMEAVGLVSSYKDGWRKREIRLNTRNVYAQTKFNMLREESEGYSKLLTLLNQSGEAKVSKANLDGILTEIKSLIGYFDLDPNRVSGIILDVFAARPENEAFVDLIKAFGVHKSEEFLRFRLAGGETVPEGFHRAAALLVSRGVVKLEDMVAQFEPLGTEYREWHAKRSSKLEDAVKKIGVVSLATKAGDDALEVPARKAGQTARTIELDTMFFRRIIGDGDQRLEFLGHLLACGAWDESMLLVRHLRDHGVREVAACECVGRALCAILDGELGNVMELVSFSERALAVISLLGHHLHFDLRVFAKVVALVSGMVGPDASDRKEKDLGLQLLVGTLLPAYNLVPSNVAIANALWCDVLSKLTYPERFRLYAEFGEVVAGSPLLLASEKLAETEARRILRRVTAPTNNKDTKKTMRPIGRLLAKVAHANPFVVCRQLLRQVMGMPGMVASISESLKYLTPMAFDVLTFSIVKQLSSGKRKLKDDGVNLEEWFQWLSLFTGIVCRTQRHVEVTALAQLVANNLKQSESLDLLVLKEIISSMTRISPTVDVSNQQLDALAGSQALVQYVVGEEEGGREIGGKTKDPARVLQRLLVALTQGRKEEQLLLPLLILLAQQKTLITLHPPSKHLKLAAELVDKCHEVTMQYVEFLQKSLSSSDYQALLPSMEELAVDYKIDAEIVMQLYRPLFRPILRRTFFCQEDGEMATAVGASDPVRLENLDGGSLEEPAIKSIQRQVTKLAPKGAFAGISWELFVCFWAFELPDLRVPKERYEGTLKQISTSKRNLEDDIASAASRGGGQYGGGQQAQQHSTELPLEKLRAELAQLNALSEVLPADMNAQSANVAEVSALFERASRLWVGGPTACQSTAASEFVQHCMLPRLLISPKDAIYCVEFLRRVHKLGSPGFRLLLVLDRLFKELAFVARCTTERESINLGIFLGELMGLISGWRKKAVFDRECAGSESFKVKDKSLTFAEWTHLTASWSYCLFEVASSCMGGGKSNYMEMKNMLLILNRCTRVYPATREDAEALLALLRPISNDDPREDLKTLARMYCTSLEMSMRDRQMVQTRQEYAGGKPPPKPKTFDEPSIKKEEASKNSRKKSKDPKDKAKDPKDKAKDPKDKAKDPKDKAKDTTPADLDPTTRSSSAKGDNKSKRASHGGKQDAPDDGERRVAERQPRQGEKRAEDARKRKREEDGRDSKSNKEARQPRSSGKGSKSAGRDDKPSRSNPNNKTASKDGKSRKDLPLKKIANNKTGGAERRDDRDGHRRDDRRADDRRVDDRRVDDRRADDRRVDDRRADDRRVDDRRVDDRRVDDRRADDRRADDRRGDDRRGDDRKRSRSDRDRDRSSRDKDRERAKPIREDRPTRRRRK